MSAAAQAGLAAQQALPWGLSTHSRWTALEGTKHRALHSEQMPSRVALSPGGGLCPAWGGSGGPMGGAVSLAPRPREGTASLRSQAGGWQRQGPRVQARELSPSPDLALTCPGHCQRRLTTEERLRHQAQTWAGPSLSPRPWGPLGSWWQVDSRPLGMALHPICMEHASLPHQPLPGWAPILTLLPLGSD